MGAHCRGTPYLRIVDSRTGDRPPTVETTETDTDRITEGPAVDEVANDIVRLVANNGRDDLLDTDGEGDGQLRYFRSEA